MKNIKKTIQYLNNVFKLPWALLNPFCSLFASSFKALTPIELVVEEWETWKAEFGKNYSQQGLSAGEESQTEHFRFGL